MGEPEPDPSEPTPLHGLWRIIAVVWMVGVVLLYVAVREFGLYVVR